MKKTLVITSVLLSLSVQKFTLAQQCNTTILAVTPDSRYTLNGNGTATDKVTGLIWQRCNYGNSWDGNSCIGSTLYYSWADALAYAENDSFADHSDWRLPNIKELASIVEESCFNPAINLTIFPNTTTQYWSSTPVGSAVSNALFINFSYGGVDSYDEVGAAIRLVRGG